MRDREVILELLSRVARRLWVDRALHEAVFGVCVILFSLVAFQLLQPLRSAVAGANFAIAVIGAGLAAFCGYVLLRIARRSTLAQAAGKADASARLKDELKSAYWFLSLAESSPFAQEQLARAACTAKRLNARQLVPAHPPPGLWLAIILATLLIVVSWTLPRLSHSWEGSPDLSGAERNPNALSMRELLTDAPREPEVEKLDRALAELEDDNASTEQLRQAAAQARDAIDEVNLRAAATRESLARLADAMKGRPGLDAVASALEAGRTRDALELLEQLRSQAGGDGRSGSEDVAIPDKAAEGARSEAGFRDAVEADGHDLMSMRVNEEAINNVLKNLEEAENVIRAQERVNQVRRRMEDFLVATSQRSALTASLFGNRVATPNSTPSPDSGSSELQGGTMFRQGAVARGEGDDSSLEGSRTGSASGHSEALALEGAMTERLEAKLKLETIRMRRTDEQENESEASWFYTPSQQESAQSMYSEMKNRDDYAQTDVMSPERIAVRQRQMVRDYFIKLHESENK